MWNCDCCGGTFEAMGFRLESDPEDETFQRVVDYKKCNCCGAGMVIYHPYMPVQNHIEQDDS
jgi:hypothetical protein